MVAVASNNVKSQITGAINNSATTLNVTSGQGALFPNVSSSGTDYFYATLIDTSGNTEIVKCTNRSTDTLTIVRAQDGTTARSFSIGDRIEMRVVAALVNDLFVQASGGGGQRSEYYGFYVSGDDLKIDYTASGSTDNYVDSDYPETLFVPGDIQVSINASGHLILTTS
mgnify:CR=1 FL=1